jgi:butyryl-CoA dehydrogenase
VLGGAGYIREYPVEQYYRDNRLNPIHEGTEAIHGIDILGRKVLLHNGAGLTLFNETVATSLVEAEQYPELNTLITPVSDGLQTLNTVTTTLISNMAENTDLSLANATVYLDLFGRVLVSWLWLKQALTAARGLAQKNIHEADENFYQGKIQAARYYIQWELPEIGPQADLLCRFDDVPFTMKNEWF